MSSTHAHTCRVVPPPIKVWHLYMSWTHHQSVASTHTHPSGRPIKIWHEYMSSTHHKYVSSTRTHSSSSTYMTVCDTPCSCKDSAADYCVVCVSPTRRCRAAGLLMTMLVWWISLRSKAIAVIHSRTTLQHPATPCSTLQHTAARCNTLWWISLRSKAPKI